MRPTESTSGKAHTTDEDYAKFSGRVVMTVSTTYYDPQRKCWIKRTCEYIDVGRPDPVTPVGNPDRQMGSERLGDLRRGNVHRFPANYTRDRIADALRQHGPLTVRDISRLIGLIAQGVRTVITDPNHAELFAPVGRTLGGGGKMATVWGLVGVHDKEVA